MDSTDRLTLADLCHELDLPEQFVLDIANGAEDSARYNSYTRSKKSGGKRYINASTGSLKRLQRRIHDFVLTKYRYPKHVHGGVRGRSVVTNARVHVGKKVVVNTDLSDFFHSIKTDKVKEIFEKRFRYDEQTSTILSQLTTFRGCLPTGAPTSSALSNLAALPLDDAIFDLLDEKIQSTEYGYSRYIDDITISGDERIIEILPEIFKAIENSGFVCNDKKTRILRRSTRQWVTGVVVNQKVNPPKKVIRKVRQAIYYSTKWGLEEHCETHGINPYRFARQILGYIAYIRLTRPDLADDFLNQLQPTLGRFNPPEEYEPDALEELKRMIDNEELAYFHYEGEDYTVAPATIVIDDDGTLIMRGFMLAPEQGWEKFRISAIEEITHDIPTQIYEDD
ncbi:MAG TPA: reverse transcriptase family protein [Drouetiella sp.]